MLKRFLREFLQNVVPVVIDFLIDWSFIRSKAKDQDDCSYKDTVHTIIVLQGKKHSESRFRFQSNPSMIKMFLWRWIPAGKCFLKLHCVELSRPLVSKVTGQSYGDLTKCWLCEHGGSITSSRNFIEFVTNLDPRMKWLILVVKGHADLTFVAITLDFT